MMTFGKDCKTVETCIQGGKGVCRVKHLTDREGLYGHGRMFAQVTIPVGCSIGDHPHTGETEFYYILKGQGLFNDNGGKKAVAAGDICATGFGEVHGLENTGAEDLEMIALIVME